MDKLIKALKAAGEPTRLRILAALSQYELTVTELVALLGQSQPRISRHLKLLLEAGLLSRFQEGSWVFQRLDDASTAADVAKKVISLIDFADPTLQKDSERLAQIKLDNAKRANDYFATHAGDWDQIRKLVGSDKATEKALLASVGKHTFDKMIDMGTGTGRIVQIFAPRVKQATGYDTSQEMLKLARANFEQSGLNHCQARLGDITALPIEDGCADLVTIHQVLHYLDSPFPVIAEIKRILAPEGKAMVVDFATHQHEFLRTTHAHRRLGFSDSEIKLWCENNALKLVDSINTTHNKPERLDVMLWVLEHGN